MCETARIWILVGANFTIHNSSTQHFTMDFLSLNYYRYIICITKQFEE